MAMSELKILFVCSQNRWRSLTAEKMYAGFGGYSVRSAGTEPGARIRVTEGHVGWADLIFAMEKRHVDRLRDKFAEALVGKQVICLHIPDDYQYMELDLIDLLKTKLAEFIEVPG
ncbi:MAG: protein tyrosine phosphatase [Pedosphaera sp.]|nr:protein tyrosine phosphatase [Pedosphaera sp.]